MKVTDLVKKLDLKVFTDDAGMHNEVTGGYVSDLLSDVMGNAGEGEAWITLQNHMNVVAIASLKDLPCIILVKGIEPPVEVKERAIAVGVAILGSNEQTFNLVGEIYQILK